MSTATSFVTVALAESVTVQRATPLRVSSSASPVEVNDVVAELGELIVMPLPPDSHAQPYV